MAPPPKSGRCSDGTGAADSSVAPARGRVDDALLAVDVDGVAQGQRVGLNLSCGVNETSFSENCFWLDGELVPVGGVRFEFQRDRPLAPWRIRSGDGRVELTFAGCGLHAERVNALLLASNFKQVYGRFDGWLRPPGRAAIRLANLWGFVEDHYAKW